MVSCILFDIIFFDVEQLKMAYRNLVFNTTVVKKIVHFCVTENYKRRLYYSSVIYIHIHLHKWHVFHQHIIKEPA